MTAKELLEGLVSTLQPIIEKDEDIIDYVEGSSLSEDEYKCFIIWLTSATICIWLGDSTSDVEKEVVAFCKNTLSAAQKSLADSGFGEEIEKELATVLQENIQEWMGIIKEKSEAARKQQRRTLGKKAKQQDEEEGNVSGEGEDTPAFACFKLHTYFLKEVIMREDDVLELIESHSEIDKDVLSVFITFNIFYSYLMGIKNKKIGIPDDAPIAQHLDDLIEITHTLLAKLANEHIQDNIKDADQFNEEMKEILNDHFNEFIKKMYKYAFRALSKKD